MDDNGIVWEDPPERSAQRPGIWVERLTPLLEHPGRWAKVKEVPSMGAGTQTVLRLRGIGKRGLDAAKLPPGRWEFRAARASALASTRAYIYARYLGPEDGA